MWAKSVGSSSLAFIALAFICTTSIAQEQRVSHLVIPPSQADSTTLIQKVASSCRSKCRQRVKRCKRKCPKGSTWGQECHSNCRGIYGACKKKC
jgi:PHP family Zn ribbon phosphoesterase